MSPRATFALIALGLLGCESIIGLEARERLVDRDSGADRPDAGDAAAFDSGTDASRDADIDADIDAASSDAATDASSSDATIDAMVDAAPVDAGPEVLDPEALCEEYCTTVLRNCTDTNTVYASREECLAVCAKLPSGDQLDPQGNTVACRLREARAARSSDEPAFHCPEAGPGGQGACGDNCESYCLLTLAACPGPMTPEGDACLRQCTGLRDLGADGTSNRFNAERDRAGDTVQCRLVYASASTLDAAECWKTQIKPKPQEVTMAVNPCLGYPSETRPRCEDYCTLNLAACSGDFRVYESRSQCLAACEKLDPGMLADDYPNDTLGCRKTHSYNALTTDPMTHCPHAGPGGANVCGSDCKAYCTIAQSACSSAFTAAFANLDACINSCTTLRGTGHLMYSVETAEDDPNPIACRLLYATRAIAGPATAEFCEAALGGGACQ